nr:MAG TPA: hypothetical protein [Caudoviricetes sp.]
METYHYRWSIYWREDFKFRTIWRRLFKGRL